MGSVKETLFNPIFNDNPIGLQILGICSALAVTSKMVSPGHKTSSKTSRSNESRITDYR